MDTSNSWSSAEKFRERKNKMMKISMMKGKMAKRRKMLNFSLSRQRWKEKLGKPLKHNSKMMVKEGTKV